MIGAVAILMLLISGPALAECVTARDTWQLGTERGRNSCDLRSHDHPAGRFWTRDCPASHGGGFIIELRWPETDPDRITLSSVVTGDAVGFVAFGVRIGCGYAPQLVYGEQIVAPTLIGWGLGEAAVIVHDDIEAPGHGPGVPCRAEFMREPQLGLDDLVGMARWREVCW